MYCILLQGSFLPLLMWEGFPGLGSELCMLMAATLYVGNAMKDLVSAPRPLGLKYEKVQKRRRKMLKSMVCLPLTQ